MLCHAELVLHYDFTERVGDVLHDRSGKGHDARIHGPGWVTTETALGNVIRH